VETPFRAAHSVYRPPMRTTPRARAVVVTVLGLVAACAGNPPAGRTPSGGYVSCTSDADCEVTTFGGCCACCPDAPRALPKNKLAQQKERCAGADCAPCSDRLTCPHVDEGSAFVAACKDGTCAALPKTGK
jgi:hypothetical protein